MRAGKHIALVGSTVSAIVCHRRLQELGIPVHWYRTESGLGGHFAGHDLSGMKLDRGMVLLETSSPLQEGAFLDLSQFSGLEQCPNGIHLRNLLPAAYDWLGVQGFEFSGVAVRTEIGGQLDRDFYIADHLDVLSRIPLDDRQRMISEIELRRDRWIGALHPRNKLDNPDFTRVSLRRYCELVYGPTFVEWFLQPIMRSFGAEIADVSARFHRQLWFPLYYPESLLNALRDVAESSKMGQEFHAPHRSSIASMVKSLWADKVHPNTRTFEHARITREPKRSILLEKDDVCVWLASEKESQKISPHKEIAAEPSPVTGQEIAHTSMAMSIEFWEIDEFIEDQSIFFTSHPEVYRLTSRHLSLPGEIERQVLMLESSASVTRSEGELREILASYISITDSRVLGKTAGAISLVRASDPYSGANDNLVTSAHFDPFEDRVGIPNSLMSFNDQLILGLWTAERIALVD